MSTAWLFGCLAAFSLLAVGAAVAGFAIFRSLRPANPSSRRSEEDPLRGARDEDRKNQQLLLAALSRQISPRSTGRGAWGPRGTHPITGRSVLEFEPQRGPGGGKKRRRRKSPDAPLDGARWPYVVSIDIRGLPAEESYEIADLAARLSQEMSAGRVRLVVADEAPADDATTVTGAVGAIAERLRTQGWSVEVSGGRVDVARPIDA